MSRLTDEQDAAIKVSLELLKTAHDFRSGVSPSEQFIADQIAEAAETIRQLIAKSSGGAAVPVARVDSWKSERGSIWITNLVDWSLLPIGTLLYTHPSPAPAGERPADTKAEGNVIKAICPLCEIAHEAAPVQQVAGTPRTDAKYAYHGGDWPHRESAYYEMLEFARQLERELAAVVAPAKVGMADDPRFFIDHGMIHDRLTGRHVHGDRSIEPGLADEAVFTLNELHASALREIKRYSESEHVAWCRYIIEHDKPTRIVLCDSDADGAFKVIRAHSALANSKGMG